MPALACEPEAPPVCVDPPLSLAPPATPIGSPPFELPQPTANAKETAQSRLFCMR